MASEPYKQKKFGKRGIREHRWVVEQVLGRRLHIDEVVHHKDGNKRNNSIDNLEILPRYAHGVIHYLKYPIIKKCQRVGCGKMFRPDKTKRKRAKTCSPACARLLAAETLKRRMAAKREL